MQKGKQKRLDHPDHFHHNHPASVAALRSLIGIRRNADRLPSGTLIDFTRIRTFSEEGIAKVVASIQVVGTTSRSAGTWMWGWANDSLPANATKDVERVRQFGRVENVDQLTKSELPDNEYLGWEMTAIAAKLLEAKGAYRCPDDNGFLYLVYSSIGFAKSDAAVKKEDQIVECSEHNKGFPTYICEHLLANPVQQWFSNEPDNEQPWPDAWCAACEQLFLERGEWNETNESKANIKMICHHCYEGFRSQSTAKSR